MGSWESQAFLLCRRWRDASAALADLLSGPDREYLRSELEWRAGDLGAAVETLRATCAGPVAVNKCSELLGRLEGWRALDDQAAAALDDGELPSTRAWKGTNVPGERCSIAVTAHIAIACVNAFVRPQ